MTTRTYNDLQRLLDLEPGDISPENTERIIEVAIGLLNLYNAELPPMSGDYGYKTIELEDRQWSAVVVVSRWVYIDFFEESAGDFSIQGLEVKSKDYLSDPKKVMQLTDLAEKIRPDDYDDIMLV